jgi:hypothetical protein
MTEEDDEFVRIEKESLWRKRQIEEHLGQPVYFKPKKEWVGLTDEDIEKAYKQAEKKEPYMGAITRKGIAEAFEQILKEKNA